jgi:hypothetical protein
MTAGDTNDGRHQHGIGAGRRVGIALGVLSTTWVLFKFLGKATAPKCSYGKSKSTWENGIFGLIVLGWVAGVASVWWQVKPKLKNFRVLLAICSLALWLLIIAMEELGGNKAYACFESIGNTLPTGLG